MKRSFSLLCTLACLPGWVLAQGPVADPTAPVPATVYRSVFADAPAGVEQDAVDWKAANAQVGQFKNGHVDILKWEQSQAQQQPGTSMPHHSPSSAPAVLPGTAKP